MLFQEEQVRAFLSCPRMFSFGSEIAHPLPYTILKTVYTRIVSNSIRNNAFDPESKYIPYVDDAISAIDNSLNLSKRVALRVQTLEMLSDIFSALPPSKYIPLAGPCSWQVLLGKHRVTLYTDAVLVTEKKHLHLIAFSSYEKMHDIQNDYLSLLKVMSCKEILKSFPYNSAQLHLLYKPISSSISTVLLNVRKPSPAIFHTIDQICDSMSQNIGYPILPCNRTCVYKSKCFTFGGKND